jgi:hypothetical protein
MLSVPTSGRAASSCAQAMIDSRLNRVRPPARRLPPAGYDLLRHLFRLIPVARSTSSILPWIRPSGARATTDTRAARSEPQSRLNPGPPGTEASSRSV